MTVKIGNRPNIILISRAWVSNSRFHECGLEYLQTNGWSVSIWMVGAPRKIDECFDKEYRKCNIVCYDTYREYDQAVRKQRDNSIFYFISQDIDLILLRPIAYYECDYIVQGNRGETPKTRIKDIYIPKKENKSKIIKGWIRRISNERFGYLKRKRIEISNWMYCAFHPVIPIEKHMPSAVFTINKLSLSRMAQKDGNKWIESARIVYVPSMQYDYYLEEEQKGELPEESFILLIASGLGFSYEGAKESVYNEDIYSQSVNKRFLSNLENLLTIMENHYGLPVIVAGHPRGVYDGYDFGGRKVIFGKTPELSKKSKVCITTISYAMTFPIIYNKRILFYYNDAIKKTPLWDHTYLAYMKELNIRGINLDDKGAMSEPWESEEIVDAKYRDDFLRNYHLSESNRSELYGVIIEEFIDNIHKDSL